MMGREGLVTVTFEPWHQLYRWQMRPLKCHRNETFAREPLPQLCRDSVMTLTFKMCTLKPGLYFCVTAAPWLQFRTGVVIASLYFFQGASRGMTWFSDDGPAVFGDRYVTLQFFKGKVKMLVEEVCPQNKGIYESRYLMRSHDRKRSSATFT